MRTLIAARLQQRREARRHETLAKRGDHAAGDKNEPRHGSRGLSGREGFGQAAESAKFISQSTARLLRQRRPEPLPGAAARPASARAQRRSPEPAAASPGIESATARRASAGAPAGAWRCERGSIVRGPPVVRGERREHDRQRRRTGSPGSRSSGSGNRPRRARSSAPTGCRRRRGRRLPSAASG